MDADVRSALLAEVDRRFAAMSPPSWPNPRPEGESPRDDEYSVTTDPERYRVTHLRARAWRDALSATTAVRVEPLPTVADHGFHLDGSVIGEFDRSWRIAPPNADAVAILDCERDVAIEEGRLPVLQLCFGDEKTILTREPDCGCDACDWGSENLVEHVDDIFQRVIFGDTVTARHGDWRGEWFGWDGCAGCAGERDELVAFVQKCERLASGQAADFGVGVEVVLGRPWAL